jgi:hypothetical protein
MEAKLKGGNSLHWQETLAKIKITPLASGSPSIQRVEACMFASCVGDALAWFEDQSDELCARLGMQLKLAS